MVLRSYFVSAKLLLNLVAITGSKRDKSCLKEAKSIDF